MSLNPVAVSRLVGMIYAAAANPGELAAATGEIARLAGVDKAGVVNAYRDGAKTFDATSGVDAAAVASYNAHFHALDLAVPSTEAPPIAFTLATMEHLWPGFGRSEFYNDWARPNNGHQIALITVPLPGGVRSSLIIVSGAEDRRFGSDEQLALLRVAEPHYRRMIAIRERLRRAERRGEHFFATLERLPYGAVVLDDRGGVTHATEKAREMIRSGDALALTGRGLRARQAEVNLTLATITARALSRVPGSALPVAEPLRVPRPGMAAPLLLHVIPLGVPGESPGWEDECAALVIIVDPAEGIQPPASLLQVAFGLTRTEAAVALRVADGHGLGPVGDELGITLSTVRTHLQRVFHKTGTSRQAELGRMIAAVAAGLGEPQGGAE